MGDALTWVDRSSRDGPHSLLALLSEMIPGSGARYRHLGLEGAMPAEAGAGGPPPLQPVNFASLETVSEGVVTHSLTTKDTDCFQLPEECGAGV